MSGDWKTILAKLRAIGIDVDNCCGEPGQKGGKVKIVCVAPDLTTSVAELGKSQRDQVVMVRVDGETNRSLDAWVETGALRSRSEAAALFIREGLKVRQSELDKLKDALREVDQAKAHLRDKARRVLGDQSTQDDE